jgi:glycosyltransferase involved in cell wall biosynthesis
MFDKSSNAVGARNETSTPMRVVLVQHASNHTGSTISGTLVAKGLLRHGCVVHVVFGGPGPFESTYRELGCSVSVIAHKVWLTDGSPVSAARRLLREYLRADSFVELLLTFRPDVVYVNSTVSLAAAVAARRLSIPCVWHLRELMDDVGGEMKTPKVGGKALVRWVLNRFSDARVAISSAVAENILGTSEPRLVTIVPNAVADNFFETWNSQEECRRSLGLPLGKPIVGVPGTLRPMKGHPFFFDAANEVIKQFPSIVFAVTGDGDEKYVNCLRKSVRERKLVDRVLFLGTVHDMPRFYQACDVICVPSRAEPFGRVVIEAFASARPVVASAVGGIREIVKEGITGMLVPFGDVPQLAERLVLLLQNSALRDEIARNARADAESHYREVAYGDAIVDVVKRVLLPSCR